MAETISIKKNTIANYIGQFYNMVIGIFVLPFYLQYLGAEQFGLVVFFSVLMSWMSLFDFGLSTTLSRETAKLKNISYGNIELKKILVTVELLFTFISIIIFLSIFWSSSWLSNHWLDVKNISNYVVEKTIKIMAFLLVLRWFVGLYQGVIIGFEQQVWLNIYKISMSTLKFLGAFFLIKYLSNDIIHFFYFQLIVAIIEFLIIRNKIISNLKVSQVVKPSLEILIKIIPFSLRIAYTSSIWLIITQLDKIMLSHYLTLKEYGYFNLVVLVSNALLQLFHPISQSLLPRMTLLISNGNEKEMINLYHKATQVTCIIMSSAVGIVAIFSYELLFSWTGNVEAAKWGAPVLFWYALGNGAVALLSFQYFIQYSYGDLRYHVKGNTYFSFIQIGVVIISIHYFGAIGAGIAWFSLQTFFLLLWPWYIHNKFVPSIHFEWVFKDIVPILLSTTIFILIFKNFFQNYLNDRFLTFIIIVSKGIILLISNFLFYKYFSKYISYYSRKTL